MVTSIPKLKSYSEADILEAFSSLTDDFKSDSHSDYCATREDFAALRNNWLGRKDGLLKNVSDNWIASAPREAKKVLGVQFNLLKRQVESFFEEKTASSAIAASDVLDVTVPGVARRIGVEHPLIKTMAEIVSVFTRMGYSVALGPEVESDFYNFESLNFPPNHPARDTQDTLVIADQQGKPLREQLLMRTHTSPVQIRSMIENEPPLRLSIPGRVYRTEAADATHAAEFYQVEGLCVGPDITFSDLKGTLDHAMKSLFGSAVKTRFFPSFFPFTEPSADVQISCIFCGGAGCRRCKHSGWIELLGCGMVDPAVFQAVDRKRVELGREPAYDPVKISGFAFGMGVERITMMKYGISDVGHLHTGDMRFLEQFA
jgi:phenylalanyl-tRNA synthetase alpha chain